MLQEVSINNGTCNTHAGITHGKIALTPHRGHSLCSTSETKDFLGNVSGDGIVVDILHIMAIDTESRQALLCVGSKYSGQINRTRAFCAVEAPHGFRVVRVHVHRLGAIAPTGGDGDGGADAFALELLGAGSALRHTTDSAVGDDALHGRAVAIAESGGYQLGNGLSQCHRLLFKAFADATLATVDGGTNPDFGVSIHKFIRFLFRHILYIR